MPFPSSQIAARFREAVASGRMAHAYLLQGGDRAALRRLAEELAAAVLKAPPEKHPDFHCVEPGSKSRRIRIEQMRDLEKNLQLKSYAGGRKVALICEAERMCIGGSEAANAFLKTLEEPQEDTLILLTSNAPQLILPTILSRCVRLSLKDEGEAEALSEGDRKFLETWFGYVKPGPLRAYARAALFGRRCQELREEIEASIEPAEDEEEEGTAKALLEGEFLLARQRLLGSLQKAVWERSRAEGASPSTETLQTLRSLEGLHASLSQNVDTALATERAALAIEGLIAG
ncbi:MAG: hypothetical protein PW734_10365 [Verrucomicrobium sp.]|nr:hypothetical protein [Verrucomicrobium sp.]